jgi:hypothetical protein
LLLRCGVVQVSSSTLRLDETTDLLRRSEYGVCPVAHHPGGYQRWRSLFWAIFTAVGH